MFINYIKNLKIVKSENKIITSFLVIYMRHFMKIMKKARKLVFGEEFKFAGGEPANPKDEAFFNLKHIMR